MSCIDDIFSVWPSAAAMARDIGVPDVTVRQWRNRSRSIPVRYWAAIIDAAKDRGVALSYQDFIPPAEAE
ncbi:carph-isopro domain-containing protein [Sphingobium jiangsuense]|uniref:carph-isopro domain-containing protein n=2 Tax=Sphingobium jiangsuense TaxID=870476 RepID=UPI003CCD3E04